MTQDQNLISAQELQVIAEKVLTNVGFGIDDARLIGQVLVWADLRGHESHGVARLLRYREFVLRGDMNPQAKPHVTLDLGALIQIDSERASGPVAMKIGVENALRGARKCGAAWVLVGQTTHTGPIGYYVDMIAREGMIGMAFAAGTPLMAYHGTAGATLSTSPFAIGVPMQGEAPFVLDMATSNAAHGKIRVAERHGRAIPEGWALTAQGEPTTNAAEAKIMMPLGGPKGSGLALAFEMICSIGTSVPILQNALTQKSSPHIQNAAICAIDVGQLRPIDGYKTSISELGALIKAQPRAKDVEELLIPGERAHRTWVERMESGVPISPKILAQLKAVMG